MSNSSLEYKNHTEMGEINILFLTKTAKKKKKTHKHTFGTPHTYTLLTRENFHPSGVCLHHACVTFDLAIIDSLQFYSVSLETIFQINVLSDKKSPVHVRV